jgi:hypothetical protein
MTIMTTNGYIALKLNPKDAVFGRGRKRDTVRKGSLYRCLIEKYWKPYSDLDTSKFAMRRAFVKKNILDALTSRGGRFVVRAGPEMFLLDPKDNVDLKLIFKKVQRALFNEKKREETKLNRKFQSKKLLIEWDDDEDEDEDDLEDSVAPALLSGSSADEDDGMQEDEEEDQYSEYSDDDSEAISTARTTRGGRTVPSVSTFAKRVSVNSEDDWDFKAVQRVHNSFMDSKMVPSVSFEWSRAESDEEDAAFMEEAKTIVVAKNERTGCRSSVKLDNLAQLACSLLFSKEDDDDAKEPSAILKKAKNPAAFGYEDEKLANIADDWNTLDKEAAAIVEDDTGAKTKPDPPASAFTDASYDVAFTVSDSSKPLKKRAFHAYQAAQAGVMTRSSKAGNMGSLWTKRCNLKPHVGDFEQYSDEHLFAAL